MNNRTVVRLGGSLISVKAGEVNHDYLEKFRDLLVSQFKKDGTSFAVICGGGKLCRSYQEGARRLNNEVSKVDLDWVGIFTNNLNAQVIRTMFPSELTHPKVVTDLEDAKSVQAPFVVVGAEAPGHSSNYDAVEIARHLGAGKIANLSNVEFIYNSDPRTNADAKKYERVTWSEYLSFIPSEWHPGLSTPFDPVSSRRAAELGLEVSFMKGDDLDNFARYLSTGEFTGSIIKS